MPKSCELPVAALAAVHSCAAERGRYALNHVALDALGGRLVAVASNGIQLAIHDAGPLPAGWSGPVLVPDAVWKAIKPKRGKAIVAIKIGKDEIRIECEGDYSICYDKPALAYPDWKGTFPPKDRKFAVVAFSRAQLVAALKASKEPFVHLHIPEENANDSCVLRFSKKDHCDFVPCAVVLMPVDLTGQKRLVRCLDVEKVVTAKQKGA